MKRWDELTQEKQAEIAKMHIQRAHQVAKTYGLVVPEKYEEWLYEKMKNGFFFTEDDNYFFMK